MFSFVPLHYYTLVYYVTMLTFSLLTGLYYLGQPGCKKLYEQNSGIFPALIALIITLYIGLRPVSGYYFADMAMYAYGYRVKSSDLEYVLFDLRVEWFFDMVMKTCKKLMLDVHTWFLVVEFFYVTCQLWACKKLLKENLWLPLLFVFFSAPFFSYGTNGIRNGMACSLMMLSLAFICDRNYRGYIIASFLFILALGCHRSVMIPMASLLMMLFFVKNLKNALIIWIFCVFLSLVSGNTFQSLFMGLGLDDRMARYGMNQKLYVFSRTGFRWDFVVYSSVPVVLSFWVAKKRIVDKTFNLIAGTYIIANSFWLLVCRVAYSNRFAYLSWFLYGLVIAYAVVRVPIWKDQDRMAGWALLGSAALTMVLHYA